MEKITVPYRKGLPNAEGLTAKDLFTKEHKELAAVGEKWMKDNGIRHLSVTETEKIVRSRVFKS